MLVKLLFGLLAVVGAAAMHVVFLWQNFISQLDAFEQQVRNGPISSALRTDLLPEVVTWAERLGARRTAPFHYVTFDRSGAMWQSLRGAEMPFTASLTIATVITGFAWRASFWPARCLMVADYFAGGQGGLDARMFGAMPAAGEAGTEAANQREALRYLAELQWKPDAILANADLEWTLLDPVTFKVAAVTDGSAEW